MDEAKRYYQTACQMDPNNVEYRQALEYMSMERRMPIGRTAVPSARNCAAGISAPRCAARICCATAAATAGFAFALSNQKRGRA